MLQHLTPKPQEAPQMSPCRKPNRQATTFYTNAPQKVKVAGNEAPTKTNNYYGGAINSATNKMRHHRRLSQASAVLLLIGICSSNMPCVAAVAHDRVRSATTTSGTTTSNKKTLRVERRSLQSHNKRSLKHKGSKGKAKGSDDTHTPTASPTTSPTVTPTSTPTISVAPTVSLAPSSSVAPTASPSASAAPTDSPTEHPTDEPSNRPSNLPSSSPSPPPTTSPSDSPSESFFPTVDPISTTTDTSDSTANNGKPPMVSQCTKAYPSTGISPVVRQVVSYQLQVEIDRNQFRESANAKVAETEDVVHAILAPALLGNCDYNGTASPQIIRVHSNQADTVRGPQTESTCAQGYSCWVVDADFTMDMFYYQDGESSRRSLQGSTDPPPMEYLLRDGSLVQRLGTLLSNTYKDLTDTADDGTKFAFQGFTNAEALASTGDVPTEDQDDTDRGGVAAVEANQASSEDNNLAGGFVLALAGMILIVVVILAVQRRRKYNEMDKLAAQHLRLDDDDEYYDEYDTRPDSEAKSNPGGAMDILQDLQDYEEASSLATSSRANATTYSRKVYVLSDAESYSRSGGSMTESMGIEIDPNWTPNKFGQPRADEQQPIFIKTHQLMDSMKDLQATPSTVGSSNRSYVAEDTVDL